MRRPCTLALVLSGALLARCGPRGDAAGPPPVPPPPTPTAAEPALALPSAPAGTLRRSACVFGERRTLGGDPVLGVFAEPGSNEVSLLRASGVRVEHATLDPADGTLRVRSTVVLPVGAQPTLAWRTSTGEPALAYRVGAEFHLARIVSGALVESTPLLRYGSPYYVDSTAVGEEWLGPIDDPNASRYVGLVLARRLADRGGFVGTLCVTDTAGMRAVRCQYQWANNEPFRSLHPASGGAMLQLAQGRGYANNERSMPVGLMQSAYAWVPYGPASTAPSTFGYGRAGTAVTRNAVADLGRGGVFLAMAPVTGVAFYAESAGPLRAQLLDAFAQPVLDPVVMPFVEASWLDALYAYGEVFATLSSRADRAVTPHTTTLVRLHPTLPADAPVTVPPVRAPLGEAKLLALRDGEILLYSLAERVAVVGRCGTLAP